MFSRLVQSFSRSRRDSDESSSNPFAIESTPAPSAISRALFLPEILENIGWHLDQASLLQGTLVSRNWRQTLIPVLWYLVEIHAKDWPDLFDEPLFTSLARNVRLVRTLSLTDLTETPSSESLPATSPDDSKFMTAVTRILQLNGCATLRSLTLRQKHKAISQGFIKTNQLSQLVSLTRLSLGVMDNSFGTFRVEQIVDTCPLLEYLHVECSPSSVIWAPSGESDSTTVVHGPRPRLLLKKLEVLGLQWSSQSFLEFISRCPDLTSLTLAGQSKALWDWTVATVEGLARACPRLYRFHIDPRYGSYFAENLLVRILILSPNLTTFNIPHCDFGQDAFEVLKERIGQIEELNVAYTRKPGMSNAQLVELMCAAHNLRRLNASGISLDPWHFNIHQTHATNSLLEMPWACQRLQVLIIGFATLHANTRLCKTIYSNLSQLTDLEQIRILPNHLPISFQAGLGELEKLRRLEHFDAHGTDDQDISREVVQWMGTVWPRLRVLRIFFKGNQHAADNGYQRVKQWLQQIDRDDVHLQVY
ncbi:MAG: hypothetical protein BYD32DRAFT_422914 [Podila humilis]|nr:MAG: hypothetical protein BYD32DRAFT_422914 [Podila humilis]